MPTFPPLPNILVRDLETLMDAYAYLLATDSRTNGVNWILGELGIGKPPDIPFGYITMLTESVKWYTADGGVGGLASGAGQDDWLIPILIIVCFEPHRYPDPITADPPASSPFDGISLPYQEAPGWRNSLQITQNIKKVMRTNVHVGGAATDTQIVESRYVLQEVHSQTYRATRLTIQTQQRRIRGN